MLGDLLGFCVFELEVGWKSAPRVQKEAGELGECVFPWLVAL